MRIVCVCVGDRYPDKWVYRLRRMVTRHLPGRHEFICFSDREIPGVKTLPAILPHAGWWSKMSLFQPGVLPGLNLYFDLDVVITGDISALAEIQVADKLHARDDFSYSLRTPRKGLGPDARRLLGGDRQ